MHLVFNPELRKFPTKQYLKTYHLHTPNTASKLSIKIFINVIPLRKLLPC